MLRDRPSRKSDFAARNMGHMNKTTGSGNGCGVASTERMPSQRVIITSRLGRRLCDLTPAQFTRPSDLDDTASIHAALHVEPAQVAVAWDGSGHVVRAPKTCLASRPLGVKGRRP
jgi:hypothetical protein